MEFGEKVLCIPIRHSKDIAYFNKFNNNKDIYNSQYRVLILLNRNKLINEYVPKLETPFTTFNTKIIQYIKNNIDVYITLFHGNEIWNEDPITLKDNEFVVYNCNPGIYTYTDESTLVTNYMYHIMSEMLINMKKTTINTIYDIFKPFERVLHQMDSIVYESSYNKKSIFNVCTDFTNFLSKTYDMLIEIFISDSFSREQKLNDLSTHV